MQQITIKLPDHLIEVLEEIADEQYDGNRSEAARALLEQGAEFDDVRRERDRLREQLAATNRRVDQHQELVEYVQEERTLAQEQSRRRKAPVWRRAKWWILGEPDEEK